eukprot:scaffold6760_cov133-Skeletonema_menzelii.AAC.3
MAYLHDYYLADDGSNDHANFDGRKNDRSHPQHVATTPHGSMTEILAATGSTSPTSPRHTKHQQAPTKQSRPPSNPETKAKKALRLKAAKHFHRGGSSSSAGGVDGTNNKKNNNNSSTTTQFKEIKSPSRVAAIQSSNKYFYPEECSSSVPAVNEQELSTDDGSTNNKLSPNVISPSPNNNSGANCNHQLDKIVEDDPAIEVYESASDIGSGYNSGSDLESAARKILRRRGAGSLNSSSKPNYNSDDNASDTGSAVSSSASSSFRKLPDGWKDRIKRKPGMSKLPPTMEKKEKQPPSKGNVAQQPQKEQHQQQQQEVLPKGGAKQQPPPSQQQQQQKVVAKQQEVPPKEGKDDDDYENYQESSGANQYYNHFSAIAGAYEDSDDDEYYQDHFNGNANGAFPSFSNHINYEVGGGPQDDTLSSILDHPPIYEEHVFGPTKPSTIYESNDEDEQDKNDDSLFNDEWNPEHLHLTSLKDDDGGVNVDRNVGPIQEEVDESGFPSPRKTRAQKNVDDFGIPSSSITNKTQKGKEQSEQTAIDERNVDSVRNGFNKDDYFHQFNQDWEHNFLPLPGVKWNTSTKRSTGAPPPITDDDILATFVDDGDTAVPSSAWGDSSFTDNFEASSSPERKDSIDERKGNAKEQQPIAREGYAKEQQPIAKPPLRQQEKTKERVSPAMQPFSDGDLSDLGNDISDAEAAVGTTTHLKRGLNFFKKRGRRYHSEGERSDSEWDTDMSKNSPRLKALSPLRRKNKQKKQMYKTNETRRKLFGSSPKKAEKSPTRAKKALSAAIPPPGPDTNLKPSNPRNMATPVASNVMKTPDSKPILSVDVNESGATDDKTVSTLGSIITRETSSKAGAKVASSSASANTAMSEIERLRKENDKLRQELERQAARRENERLRQELEKRAANEAASAHPPRHHDGSNERGDEKFPVKKNSPNGLHKSTLSSLLESDMKAKQHSRRHRVTKNHLMNQADFDDESITTYSPTRPNRHFDYMSETTGTEILSRVAGATGWVTSQVRNAANGQGQRPLDCFTACARNGRGRRRRRGAKGDHDDSESDTDSLEDDSLFRSGGRPRPPIARRRRGNANRKREQFL